MGKKDIKERNARAKVYHLAKYRLVSESSKEPVMTSIENIGRGGVCIYLDGDLPCSSVVQLYISLPQIQQPIPTLAKVVWTKRIGRTNRYKAGLQFLEIEALAQQSIEKRVGFVDEHLRKK